MSDRFHWVDRLWPDPAPELTIDGGRFRGPLEGNLQNARTNRSMSMPMAG
jgi:hypothetical protein